MPRVRGAESPVLDVRDRGLQAGDGLFETIAFADGEPQLWDRHMARLAAGCARLGIPVPDIDMLRTEADRARAGAARTIVKIIVTRGSGAAESLRPTVIVVSRDWPADLVARRRDGVDARISGTRLPRLPRLAGIKHLNRLAYVLADQDRQADPAQEIILRDTQGYVIETTRANIFCVRSGRLHTPDLRYAGVRGVVRDEVMAIARGLGMAVAVAWLTPRELFTADEVFVTNAVIGICPVRRIEGRDYPVGPVTTKLQEALTV